MARAKRKVDHREGAPRETLTAVRSLSLRLTDDEGPPLTKAQRRFAQLLKRVETLRAERGRREARWEKFLQLYPERILPEERRMVERGRQVVLLLAERWRAPKGLGARQRELLEDLLRNHLNEVRASGFAERDEDMRKLWETLHPELKGEPEDGDPGEAGSEESEAAGQEFQGGAGFKDSRGVSGSDDEREAARKRTMGVIYKQLAKALHPDLEQDPVMRERKHTLMQELTKANREGDLHTLLRLEMDWLTREPGASDLRGVGEDKLGIYAELLEEQIEELQAALREVAYQPRFAAVARFMDPTGEGPNEIERLLLLIRQRSEALKEFRDGLAGPKGKETLRMVLAAFGERAARCAAEADLDEVF